jgi:hypothetical protein
VLPADLGGHLAQAVRAARHQRERVAPARELAGERDGRKVAEVSKRWFRVRDTYGMEVAPGVDDALIIAVTVCIDRMGRGS